MNGHCIHQNIERCVLDGNIRLKRCQWHAEESEHPFIILLPIIRQINMYIV